VHYCERAANDEFWQFEFRNGTSSLENLLREPAYIFLEVVSVAWFNYKLYTAISIKIVPKQSGKVEYEREIIFLKKINEFISVSQQAFRARIRLFRFVRGQP
jgi:hypothetical protein